MEMHQLRYFAKVAECGNFTHAAAACHVSQPSLSQQIAKLERELGQPLFERLGRGAKLTEAGRIFKERVDQILRLADDARASVADEPDAGRLVVGAIPTIAPYFLPELIAKFTCDNPRANLEIVEETTKNLLRLCSEGEVDLAVLALPIHHETVQIEPLFTEELVAALPERHPLASKSRATLKDLAVEPFVLLNEAHCLTENTLSFCSRHSVAPVATAQIHQLTMLLEMVRLGQGVSLIPEMGTRTGAARGVVFRSLTGEKPSRGIAMAWSRHRFQTKLFQRFVRTVREYAAGYSRRG